MLALATSLKVPAQEREGEESASCAANRHVSEAGGEPQPKKVRAFDEEAVKKDVEALWPEASVTASGTEDLELDAPQACAASSPASQWGLESLQLARKQGQGDAGQPGRP